MSELRGGLVDGMGMRFVAGVAALGLLSGGLAACSPGGSSPQPSPTRSEGPTPHATEQPLDPHNVTANYDAAADYLIQSYDQTFTGPASIPNKITNPTVRALTLKATELLIASDVVSINGYDSVAEELKEVGYIKDPAIAEEAKIGLVLNAYGDLVQGLEGQDTTNLADDETIISKVLAGNPAALAQYKEKITAETARANTVDALQNEGVYYYNLPDQATLEQDSQAATIVASKFQDALSNDYYNIRATVLKRSPAEQKTEKETAQAEYIEAHQCDNVAPAKLEDCDTEAAINAVPSDTDSFIKWASHVKSRANKNRLSSAAEAAAEQDIQYGNDDDAVVLQKYVTNPSDSDKLDKAFAAAVQQDIDYGNIDVAQDELKDIRNPKIRKLVKIPATN